MRPKKVILCIDDNEQDLSVLSFMLSTNGYRVLSATSGAQALEMFSANLVDLVLADSSIAQTDSLHLIARLKQAAAHVPMALLGDPQKLAGNLHAADAVFPKKSISPHELLERVKIMSARKRGPRKGMHRLAHTADLAVAS